MALICEAFEWEAIASLKVKNAYLIIIQIATFENDFDLKFQMNTLHSFIV